MTLLNKYSFAFYMLSIVMAMILRIIPVPAIIQPLLPDWVLLVLIYWVVSSPDRIGVLNAWLVGLFIDVLTGRLLGQYALAYALVGYVCIKLHKRLRHFPLFQQSLFIFLVLLLSQSIIFWTETIQGPTLFQGAFWLPLITGTLCWPLIYSLLHRLSFSRRLR